jgi:HSP20 family protein
MNKFVREIERKFEPFGWPRGFSHTFPKEVEEVAWIPEAEYYEKDGRLVVRTDLPGLSKEDVKVEIANERLIIYGERKREREEKGEYFVRSERAYGSFYRTFALPEGVNPETVKATFNNGVLEVTLAAPVVPEVRTKKVEIEEKPAKAATKAA